MNFGRRGEGPLQNLYLTLILLAVGSFAAYAFISGVGASQDISPDNTTSFTQYQETFDRVDNSTQSLNNKLADATGSIDIITILLGSGFGVLLDILTGIPSAFNTVINQGLVALGLGAYAGFASTAILVIVIFSILALIMKVRA